MPKITAQRPDNSGHILGRDRELRLLSDAVGNGDLRVFHVYGVPGIGKSSLIRAFAGLAKNKSRICLLDGHTTEPTERGFLHQLSRVLRIDSQTLTGIARALSAIARPVLVIVDSYELLGLLDAWLRQSFMARVTGNVHLILGSRFPPASQWSEVPEWRGKFGALQLQPLDESAALELLANLGTPLGRAREVAKFGHGHPLTLVIGGAAAAAKLPSAARGTPPAAISALARRFLAEVEDPQIREALRAASVVRRITRSLLRALMPEVCDDALFESISI